MRFMLVTAPPLSFTTFSTALAVTSWGSLWFLLAALLVFFGACDVRARYKDYLRLKTRLTNSWHSERDCLRLARRYRHSWCQRHAATKAFEETHTKHHIFLARRYYRLEGYRWFHVLPDGTFSLKSPYLRPSFYKALIFGTPKGKQHSGQLQQ